MSLIVAWVGIDTHSVSSAYIASDSRVSWSNGQAFDSCRKTFFSMKYPELISYCGSVLFPSLLISSILEAIDSGMVFAEDDPALQRYKKFKKILFAEFHRYPNAVKGDAFELLYINKDKTSQNYPRYYFHQISWRRGVGFNSTTVKQPMQSGLIHVMGSGSRHFKDSYKKFQKHKSRGTSRNVYQCFAHLMLNEFDPSCGGAPQLVGLYRKPSTNGFAFGIIHKRRRYYNGLNIGRYSSSMTIEWRNRYFEMCSARPMLRIPGSQVPQNDLGH